MSFASCATKPAPSVGPPSGATTQCRVNCVSVSKSFVKEHFDWGAEVVRLKAALKLCQEK